MRLWVKVMKTRRARRKRKSFLWGMSIYRFQRCVGVEELRDYSGRSGVIMRRDACMGVAGQSIEDEPCISGGFTTRVNLLHPCRLSAFDGCYNLTLYLPEARFRHRLAVVAAYSCHNGVQLCERDVARCLWWDAHPTIIDHLQPLINYSYFPTH